MLYMWPPFHHVGGLRRFTKFTDFQNQQSARKFGVVGGSDWRTSASYAGQENSWLFVPGWTSWVWKSIICGVVTTKNVVLHPTRWRACVLSTQWIGLHRIGAIEMCLQQCWRTGVWLSSIYAVVPYIIYSFPEILECWQRIRATLSKSYGVNREQSNFFISIKSYASSQIRNDSLARKDPRFIVCFSSGVLLPLVVIVSGGPLSSNSLLLVENKRLPR